MSVGEFLPSIPSAYQKHVDPNTPVAGRMMAAKGVLPLPPQELVIILCALMFDENTEVTTAAAQSLAKLPDKLVGGALSSGLPTVALRVLASALVEREPLLLQIVLHRDTPDDAIAAVAKAAPASVAEVIASNQERCLRSSDIVHALVDNQNLLRSSRDRLFDFLVRAGVVYEDLAEFAEAIARLSPAEMAEAAAKIPLPPTVLALTEEHTDDDARAQQAAAALDTKAPDAKVRVPMLKLIASLSVAQRVALAFKGNKEARTILLRDMNRVVASATIRNPHMSEQEVISAAQSRTVCDEVIRIIASSKELTRTYGVKAALVNNPKTPLPTAMRLLTLLREADVRAVAKSKNVTTAVTNQARRILAQKQKSG